MELPASPVIGDPDRVPHTGVLVHNKLFFSPKFNNSNKKSPLVPL